MKPGLFINLPAPLRERMLWDMNYLDYDQYESSKAECIHGILNGNISSTNHAVINTYYQHINEETLLTYAKQELESLKNQVSELTQFVFNLSN